MSTTAATLAPRVPDRIGQPPAEVSWVPRFGPTERFAHWWTVLMLLAALLTGVAMGDESRSGALLAAHVAAVVLIGVGLIAAALFGNHRALLAAGRQLFLFDRRDASWLETRLRHPFRPHAEPAWGMFNTGQKVLAWAISASVAAVMATGVQAWSTGSEGSGLHGATVVVTLVLLGAHIFMAVVNPSTRPALPGMVFGRVRRSWAAKHHSEWLDKS